MVIGHGTGEEQEPTGIMERGDRKARTLGVGGLFGPLSKPDWWGGCASVGPDGVGVVGVVVDPGRLPVRIFGPIGEQGLDLPS